MKNLLTILFLFGSVQSFAQVKANLSQLEFMSGLWIGKMEWGNIEEFWSKPDGDNMICTFRLTNDGQAQFYEFIVIEQSESGVPVMRLRHFSRGNIAWEEKDKPYEYTIVKLEENKAVFELRIRRPD